MNNKLKLKVNGVKVAVMDTPLPGSIIPPEVFETLSTDERFIIQTIVSNPDSFMATVQINGKDVTVFATPGCSITVPQKNEPKELHTVECNPITRTGRSFPETHPVLFLAYSDITIEEVVKRNIFGWVKLNAINVRNSTAISIPVQLGPETYGTAPFYTIKVGDLNEVEIIDSEINNVEAIVGTSITNSRIVGKGRISFSIINDLNLTAKDISITYAFISSIALHVKELIIKPNHRWHTIALIDHNFFGKNASVQITYPFDLFKLELGLFSVTFATGVNSTEAEPEFFAFSGHYADDEKVALVKSKNIEPYLDQIKAELINQSNILYPNTPIDNSALESVLQMVLNSLTSRAGIYRMINGNGEVKS